MAKVHPPYRVTPKGSEFKIGTNDLFVDIPISPLNSALNRIYQIKEDSKTPEDAYQKIKGELEDINSDIQKTIEETVQEKRDWITVFVRRPPFSNKKYSIQLNIQWDKLLQFLDKVANSQDISLSDKYSYFTIAGSFSFRPKQMK